MYSTGSCRFFRQASIAASITNDARGIGTVNSFNILWNSPLKCSTSRRKKLCRRLLARRCTARRLSVQKRAIILLDHEQHGGLALLIKTGRAPLEKTRYSSGCGEGCRSSGIKFARTAAFWGCSERVRYSRSTTPRAIEFGWARNVFIYTLLHKIKGSLNFRRKIDNLSILPLVAPMWGETKIFRLRALELDPSSNARRF